MTIPRSICVLWTNPILRWRVGLTLLITATTMTLTAWAMEDVPYKYIIEGSHIRPPVPEDGQDITSVWKVEPVRKLCPATSRRELSDPKSEAILANYTPTPRVTTVKLGDREIVKTFTLPKGTLPYEVDIDYRSLICFSCNPLQYVYPKCVWTPRLKFQVQRPRI